mmetsp:Transcript_11363/g.18491  ORF Transcript_11363/g.18491 Transcript_11363/m.18491 type:complete len:85 (+) Transcript_11363:115-369(+)
MSFRRFLTHKDLRIAKVGKRPSAAPCSEYMSAYMDCMAHGTHDSKVPPHLSREFHKCIDEFYNSSEGKKAGIKTQLSKYLLPPR